MVWRLTVLFFCSFCLALATQTRTQEFPAPTRLQIVGIARDPKGLMWLATLSGVYRFDGLHYHRFSTYPFSSAHFIAAENDGTIWAGAPQGLAAYRDGEWHVQLTEPVKSMAMSSDGLWVHTNSLRLVHFGQPPQKTQSVNPTSLLQMDSHGALWFVSQKNVCILRAPQWQATCHPSGAEGEWLKVVPEADGHRYILSSLNAYVAIEDGKVAGRNRVESGFDHPWAVDPEIAPDGKVWGLRIPADGKRLLSIWTSKPTNGFGGYFADAATRWFSNDKALCKSVLSSNWDLWGGTLFVSLVPQGFLQRKQGGPVAYTTRGILEQNGEDDDWRRVAGDAKLSIRNLIEDGFGGYWAATLDEGLVRLGPDFRISQRFPKLCPSIDTFRALLHDNQGRTWAGGKDSNCFYEIKGTPGNWRFEHQTLPDGTFQTVDLHTDPSGRPWIGYNHGLAYREDNGTWTRIRTSQPVELIRTFAFAGSDVLWVSHRRNGPFSRLERHGDVWQVRSFPPERYGPNDTQFVQVDSRGWIWRGTGIDVQVARPGHLEPQDWLHFSKFNGLGSSGVVLRGWSEDDKGYVWLGGDAGITKIAPSELWFQANAAKAPLVSRVSIGGQEYLDSAHLPQHFRVADGPVEIDLSAMDAPPFHASPIRYRLDGDWRTTADGRIHIPSLAAGTHKLEAAYAGVGTAAVMNWQFEMTHPMLSDSARLMLLSVSSILGALVWRFRDFLQYWLRKRAFLIGRRFGHQPRYQQVVWTNQEGRTLRQRYQLRQILSRSTTSTTYTGWDLVNEDSVVVKILSRNPEQSRDMRIRLANEVAALHTLKHPGVVRILDSWISADGEPCLVMPYLEGPTLRQLITSHAPLSNYQAASILEGIGAAAGAIHECGIVHRDLKPENLIILHCGESDEQPVIIDLGSSAARGPLDEQEETTTLTGSLHYLAPERLAGSYSTASDMYSLGVIALELLTGMRPAEMEFAPASTEFIPFVGTFVGAQAAGLIAAALSHRPAQRPPSPELWAQELAEAVRRFSGNRQDAPPST